MAPFLTDAICRAVRKAGRGPRTGLPLAFTMVSGDGIDNCQANELRWYIDILDGQTVTTNSGSPSLDHSVTSDALGLAVEYWHPASFDFEESNHNGPGLDNYFRAGYPAVAPVPVAGACSRYAPAAWLQAGDAGYLVDLVVVVGGPDPGDGHAGSSGQVLEPVGAWLSELSGVGDQKPQVMFGGEHPVPGPGQGGEQRILAALVAGQAQALGQVGLLGLRQRQDGVMGVAGLIVEVGPSQDGSDVVDQIPCRHDVMLRRIFR